MKRRHNPRTASCVPSVTGRRHRRFHLVDIENLVGTGTPSADSVSDILSRYVQYAMGPSDQGRAAMSRRAQSRFLHLLPSQLRWVIAGTGPDAADDALLYDCDPQLLVHNYDEVVFATGDHRFAALASWLRDQGVHVTVTCRRGSLAKHLAAQADTIMFIDDHLPTRIDATAHFSLAAR